MKRIVFGVPLLAVLGLIAYGFTIASFGGSAPLAGGTSPATGRSTGHHKAVTLPPEWPAASTFQSIDLTQWSTYITNYAAHGFPWNSDNAGGSSIGSGLYNDEYFLPSHIDRTSGIVAITATPGATEPGYSWTSGVLSSYGHASFLGGYIQIEARIPDTTTGAWPALWLVASPSDPDTDEIDLFEGGLTSYDDTNYNYSGFIHTDGKMAGGTFKLPTDLAAGVHTYAINWVPGKSVSWYLDNKLVETVTSRQVRIPSKPMALILDMQVAAPPSSGWHTVADGNQPFTMQVLGVQYARNPGTP